MNDPQPPRLSRASLVRRHLRHGWIGLLVFSLLGITLEGLHAWKAVDYLGVGHETRRLLWTLAHAHGIGLSLVQLAFAATLALAFDSAAPRCVLAGRLLDWAALLVPLGFFLGGVSAYEADPGLGILLVPAGALLLLAAIACLLSALARDDA